MGDYFDSLLKRLSMDYDDIVFTEKLFKSDRLRYSFFIAVYIYSLFYQYSLIRLFYSSKSLSLFGFLIFILAGALLVGFLLELSDKKRSKGKRVGDIKLFNLSWLYDLDREGKSGLRQVLILLLLRYIFQVILSINLIFYLPISAITGLVVYLLILLVVKDGYEIKEALSLLFKAVDNNMEEWISLVFRRVVYFFILSILATRFGLLSAIIVAILFYKETIYEAVLALILYDKYF